MSENNFKLLAIRPLSGCSPEILKNLEANKCYILDNSYEFDNSLNTLRKKDNYKDISNLYSTGELNIQISTIVGENGSGKTSLIELIISFMTLIIVKSSNDEEIIGFNCEIYFYHSQINVLKFENNIFKLNNKEVRALNLLEDEKLYWFLHYLNYSPFSLLNNNYAEYFSHKNNNYWENILITPKRENNILHIDNELLINQLNSLYILSHYNPLNLDMIKYNFKEVKLLNFRIGNIDESISHYTMEELPLSEDELIDNYRRILNVVFNIYDVKLDVVTLLNQYIGYNSATATKKELTKDIVKGYCLIYIVNKLIKFSKTLEGPGSANGSNNIGHIYFTSLSSEPSHLSFKLVQTINFFKDSLFFDKIEIKDEVFYLSHESLCEILQPPLVTSSNIIGTFEFYVPISGFDITLLKDTIDLSKNSSGQLQIFSTISNILINLIRLNSRTYEHFIRNKETENASGRFFYNTVVVLDELEINLHPKFQKNLIKQLIKAIGHLNLSLKSIHIILLTHSPFILSDIPSQNVLKLQNGKPVSNDGINSFGANIYDLLNDDFFLKDGFIGDYASKLISEILSKENIEQDDLDVINLIGDPFLKGVIKKKIEDKLSNEVLDKEIARLSEIRNQRNNTSGDATN